MPTQDLGYGAAELVSLSTGEARSLSRLAGLAVSQVPGCVAAHAAIWREGELAWFTATHPDSAELSELQLRTGRGPLFDAAARGGTIVCTDTLTETRWPEWASAALARGIRCAVDLSRRTGPVTLVLAMFGVRPGALDAETVPMAEMLAELGGAVLAGSLAYDESRRTATQLQDSVAARSVTDQAKGILMQSLGCDAEEALATLRRESQRRHVKVTEVAQTIIDRRGRRG